MRKEFAAAIFLLLAALFTACRTGGEPPPEAEPSYPVQSVELIAPAGTGSGYDVTIRSVAQCLADTQLVSVPLPVTNKPGSGGGVALSYLSENPGRDDILSVFSPPLCLINLNGSTSLNYQEDTTPIARLICDYGCFAVAADSPYQTLRQVMDTLKEDPSALRIGGTSSFGSMDHIQFLKAAQAAGVERLNQIPYTGFEDGTAAAQLMGGHVDVISIGISDSVGLVESGDIRVLAVTAERRVGSGLVAEMPTCVEQGIDMTFVNWRGIFGPKDMPDYALRFWEDILEKMTQTPEWEETCGRFGWDMAYQGHEEFKEFLQDVNGEYAALLDQIGMLESQP